MKILITNDDGVQAHGIYALADAVHDFGEVQVIAPDRERSACGHSMTMADPLRTRAISGLPVPAIAVTGVPVDCVNVGLSLIFKEGCDLVMSGFNHGPNLGFDITYSGTVGGAIEGCLNGIPSIAISMAPLQPGLDQHFETGSNWLRNHLKWLLSLPLPPRTFWNINVPAVPMTDVKGIKFTEMGGRVYEDKVEMRNDPWGKPYFWQGGMNIVGRSEPGSDLEAIENGYVSITPLSLNWTQQEVLNSLVKEFGTTIESAEGIDLAPQP